jgi:hypothetical protein
VRFASSCGAKVGEHALHRGARSDLALLLATYSVGQRKQPSMSADITWLSGDDVTDIVLIVPAYSSPIGELGELHVKHRTTRGNTDGQHQGMRLSLVLALSEISHPQLIEKGEHECSPSPDELFSFYAAPAWLWLPTRVVFPILLLARVK